MINYKADEYVDCAAECLRLASRADENETKAYLLDIAERWLELAELARNSAWSDADDDRDPTRSLQ
jgi:hypothetical protein